MTHIIVTFHDRAIPNKGYYYGEKIVVEINGKELVIKDRKTLEKVEKESKGLIKAEWSKCRFFKGKLDLVHFTKNEDDSLELLYLVIKKEVKILEMVINGHLCTKKKTDIGKDIKGNGEDSF